MNHGEMQYLEDKHQGLVGVVNALIHTLLQAHVIDAERLTLSLQAMASLHEGYPDRLAVFDQVLKGLEAPRWQPRVIEGGQLSSRHPEGPEEDPAEPEPRT